MLRSYDRYPSTNSPTFVVGDNNFDVTKGKSKDYYNLFIREKAKPPNTIQNLRGPAPKKRPMISGSKIESADFYFPSRGYRILFKNEFLLFQFRFKPKISSRKLFPSDSRKKKAENKPPQKNGSEITIATQNNEKNYTVLKKKAF